MTARDEAIRLARECGCTNMGKGMVILFDELEAFYLAAKAKGAEEENEACADTCESSDRHRGGYFAAIIRARKEKGRQCP